MPRVIGLRLAKAKTRIRGQALLRRVASAAPARRRVGRVIGQNPRPGVFKRRGFPVKLVVGRR